MRYRRRPRRRRVGQPVQRSSSAASQGRRVPLQVGGGYAPSKTCALCEVRCPAVVMGTRRRSRTGPAAEGGRGWCFAPRASSREGCRYTRLAAVERSLRPRPLQELPAYLVASPVYRCHRDGNNAGAALEDRSGREDNPHRAIGGVRGPSVATPAGLPCNRRGVAPLSRWSVILRDLISATAKTRSYWLTAKRRPHAESC